MKLQALNTVVPKKTVAMAVPSVGKIYSKDEIVIDELKNELSKTMEEKETALWINRVLTICKNLNIAPQKLPVNEKFPGSLTKNERVNFFEEICTVIFPQKR